VILGAITAVGGGTIRDIVIRKVPSVMAAACFLLRLIGVRFRLNAPKPPGAQDPVEPPGHD
jgi:uncharacterized membrane protein YeiH